MGILGDSLADLMKDRRNQKGSYQASLDVDSIPNFEFSRDLSDAVAWCKKGRTKKLPFPINELLNSLSVLKLNERDDLGDISGFIEKRTEYWEIAINQYHSQGRKNFTAAHELGHLLFHREYLESQGDRYDEPAILMRSSLFNKVEDEANTFASELLMPKDAFKEVWLDGSEENTKAVAKHFGVSTQAARYRAYKLRLIREY